MLFQFGPYMPDLPDAANQALTVATNAIPTATGYRAVGVLTAQTDALTGRFLGGLSVRATDGVYYIYAGSATKLEELSGTSWDDVTRSTGGAYATASGEKWEMVQWGNTVIATNFTDELQTITLGGANFAALATSTEKPNARHIAVVGEFVVIGNIIDSTGTRPQAVRWCAIGDPTDWDDSASTQADSQDLREYGPVTRIIGGEYGLVFQENAITRMTYVGPPAIFQIDVIETNRGTRYPGSVVKVGALVYYWGEDAFYVCDGNSSRQISTPGLSRTVKDALNSSNTGGFYAALDPVESVIYWAYPGAASTDEATDLIAYHYTADKWSTVTASGMDGLMTYRSPGYTLEGLDAISASLDALPASLDSSLWKGGTPNLAVFYKSDFKLYTYSTSSYADAVFETGDLTLFPEQRAAVRHVRPVVESAGTITVQVGRRNSQQDSVTWGPVSSLRDSGIAPLRADTRYPRIRFNISGGFDKMAGFELEASPSGQR